MLQAKSLQLPLRDDLEGMLSVRGVISAALAAYYELVWDCLCLSHSPYIASRYATNVPGTLLRMKSIRIFVILCSIFASCITDHVIGH